jgi:hypothetical protein
VYANAFIDQTQASGKTKQKGHKMNDGCLPVCRALCSFFFQCAPLLLLFFFFFFFLLLLCVRVWSTGLHALQASSVCARSHGSSTLTVIWVALSGPPIGQYTWFRATTKAVHQLPSLIPPRPPPQRSTPQQIRAQSKVKLCRAVTAKDQYRT